LCGVLEQTADRDVEGIRNQILAEVANFTPTQADDMTVVVLRYR
jgi:hypothetical protein